MGWRDLFNRSSISITTSIPSNIAELSGKKERGPNCWNATMLYFDPNQSVRYVPPEEMWAWITLNTVEDEYKLCRPNTILALYAEYDLIHTAVYVGPGTLFHKRGCGGAWEFITEKQLRKIYCETTLSRYLLFKDYVD